MKKVLIVGSNFINKGAQSMLFITTDELRKRDPDCIVYFACNGERYKEADYKFVKLLYTKQSQSIALQDRVKWYQVIKAVLKDIVKLVLGRKNKIGEIFEARKIIPSLDLIIDVSGYALADICSPMEHEYYLDNIRLAKKYNIPMILMPQSFGPFNYSLSKQYLKDEIADLLRYPKVIFAREEEGKELLQKEFKLTNLAMSADLVLQNKGVTRSNICNSSYEMQLPRLDKSDNVAIIPNYHCFAGENNQRILELYRTIIQKLLEAEKKIYIFRHASGDADICSQIKGLFSENDKVHLIKREFDCLEYDELVKDFDFIICSRYHGCVHAYRNGIPNIILGWAVKYQELAMRVNQEAYIFNLTSDVCDSSAILDAVEHMLNNYEEESCLIKEKVELIQENSCFSCLDEIEW